MHDGYLLIWKLYYLYNLDELVFISDKDECDISNGGCDDVCVNIEGSYTCTCRNGYVMDTTTNKCIGENVRIYIYCYSPNIQCTTIL